MHYSGMRAAHLVTVSRVSEGGVFPRGCVPAYNEADTSTLCTESQKGVKTSFVGGNELRFMFNALDFCFSTSIHHERFNAKKHIDWYCN